MADRAEGGASGFRAPVKGTVRPLAAGLLLALAVMLSPTQGARAQDGDSIWFFTDAYMGDASAVFGVPETDNRIVALACFKLQADAVEIFPELYLANNASPPRALVFEIDGESFERAFALAYSDLVGAFRAEVTANLLDPVVVAIRRGQRLSIRFEPPQQGGEPVVASLAGSARAIRQMLAAC